MTNFEIIFDNGGCANLQTDADVFCFSDMAALAESAKGLMAGDSTSGWDGSTPECRISSDEYEAHASNGGYRRIDAEDCNNLSDVSSHGWCNVEAFLAAMA